MPIYFAGQCSIHHGSSMFADLGFIDESFRIRGPNEAGCKLLYRIIVLYYCCIIYYYRCILYYIIIVVLYIL